MYRVFLRSARNWDEFSKARKRTVRRRLTLEQARDYCRTWNANRDDAAIRRGTKAEFEGE